MEDDWIDLSSIGITTEPFVIVVNISGDQKNYIYYFEGTA